MSKPHFVGDLEESGSANRMVENVNLSVKRVSETVSTVRPSSCFSAHMENASLRSHSSSSSLTASEVISGIDDARQDAVVVAVVPPRSPAKERRVSDSSQSCPRLASLTELLLMNQKAAPKGNSSTSSDSTRCLSATFSSSDQTPSPVPRTSRSDEEDATEMRRGGGGGGAHRRRPVSAAAAATVLLSSSTESSPSGVVVETDLRRFVFHHSRAQRLVSGLRVRAFTRQAFVSSFTVGLALGSVIAIVLKILRHLAQRILYG